MLAKLSVFLFLFQIIAITHGGVLLSNSDDESCTEMYLRCSTQEECCGNMRCLDFGVNRRFCGFGTDNPLPNKPEEAVQPPVDLIKNPGCSLYGQTCEDLLDCCAPHVCSSDKTCKRPDPDPYGLGPAFPGK